MKSQLGDSTSRSCASSIQLAPFSPTACVDREKPNPETTKLGIE